MRYCDTCGAPVRAGAFYCDQCGAKAEQASVISRQPTLEDWFTALWGALSALGAGLVLTFLLISVAADDLHRSGDLGAILGGEILGAYRSQLTIFFYYVAHGIPVNAGGQVGHIPGIPWYVYLLPAIPLTLGGALAITQTRRRRVESDWSGGVLISIPYVVVLILLRGSASIHVPFLISISPHFLGTIGFGWLYSALAGTLGGALVPKKS